MAASLSSTKCSCGISRSSNAGSRLLARPTGLPSTASRSRSVQVFAKGKGNKRAIQQMMPQGQMVSPPIPEVDAENEEFCVFTRSTSGTYQNWIFVSVVKGGNAANALVKSLSTEWGRRLYGRTLISNIGNAVYTDRDAIVKGLKGQIRQTLQLSNMAPQARIMEPLLNQPTSSFEFAFKIRDKSRPRDFQKAEGLTVVPREAEIRQLPLDKARAFFSADSLASMLGGGASA